MSATLKNICIFVFIGLSLVLSWNVLGTHVVKPSTLHSSENEWHASFPNKGQTTTFRLSFDILSPKAQKPEDSVRITGDATENRLNCVVANSSDNSGDNAVLPYSCKTLFTSTDKSQELRLSALAGVTLTKPPKIEIVKKIRNAPFPVNRLFNLFFILLAFAPIIWALHRYKTVSQWVMVGLAVGLLMWLQPVFSSCLLALIGTYYFAGQSYRRSNQRTSFKILAWVVLTAIILMIFKNFKAVFFLPFEAYGALTLVLPLGTSYFLIRLIDLQLRWHRGQLEDLSFREYLTYVLFPPTIVAGPIELIDGFRSKRLEKISFEDISYGLMRISVGVAKKLIVVDFILASFLFGSGLWDSVALNPFDAGMNVILFCLLAYLFAYLDFSAYSDIAIGMSRLYGYDILENFNWPVLADNISEFWKRWHISLSSWCFRNIFFPILLSSKSRSLALLSTLFAVGLWHDLSLSWMTWGLYHGIGLTTYAYVTDKKRKFKLKIPRALSLILTNIYVAFGFAFGSISDYGLAWQVFIKAWLELLLMPFTLFGMF
ncbi:MAG: MBOAT family O-acyltransferase [Litorimonas sp.]